jgi:hypothetical protein
MPSSKMHALNDFVPAAMPRESMVKNRRRGLRKVGV